MLMQITSLMNTMNSKGGSRSNLLLSLKPFLKNSRQFKGEQYSQLLNILGMMGNRDF